VSLTLSVVAALVLPAASVAVTVYVKAIGPFGLPGVAATFTEYAPEPFAVVEYVPPDPDVTLIEAFASA
jgi:hypothetical protein